MEQSNFIRLLRFARNWDTFNFKQYRKYLDAKAKWKTKMN